MFMILNQGGDTIDYEFDYGTECLNVTLVVCFMLWLIDCLDDQLIVRLMV